MKQIKDYLGTMTAIHCSTEEELKQIVKLCLKEGLTENISRINSWYCDLYTQMWRTEYYIRNYNYTIIPASEFLEPKIEIEFGYPVGCLNWAYEVARIEGEVWHKDIYSKDRKFCYNNDNFKWNESGTMLQLNIFFMTGWYRKLKDAKEELIEEFTNACLVSQSVKDYFKKLLENYEIKRKEE